ncbi:hypothetical protein HAHE_36340 [Haloferula helveola]|uniref:Uncharacterized protein n=1 Tax=Haloferula helveola TaxID=490095 RepID=A0ABN6H7T7_9BACT|nr:hypothetical protein HAHE_36340 [Haloferula helveola]
MTPTRSPRGGRSTLGSLAIAFAAFGITTAQATEDVPRGTLTVDRDMVRVGVHSQLDWEITYPTGVTDIVDVDPNGTITPKRDVRMKVRVLGVAFQSGNKLLPLDGYWAKNGSSWSRFFYGIGTQVIPGLVLVDEQLKAGDYVDFGARGWDGRGWLPFHHTRVADPYVTVLKDGDTAPDYTPAYNQDTIEGFLAPYIAGDKISIGERDLIVLWEASTAKMGSKYFDMQDLVVLLTFE